MLEKSVEKKLVEGVKKLGGRAYKFVSPGNSGVPDRIVVFEGRTYFVELKTDKGRLSPIQKIQIKRLESMRVNVRVLWGEKDVNLFLAELERIKIELDKIGRTFRCKS